MQDRLKKMEKEMAERTDYESDDYNALVERFTEEHERYIFSAATTTEPRWSEH